MSVFTWPVRIYYEDTDSGDVVYHANYLKFMERARTEWLRSLGIEQDELVNSHHCIFVVNLMQLHFRQPARLNDALIVFTHIIKASGVSFEFEQQVKRDGELLCEAIVKVVCLDSDGFRPKPIPAFILMEIESEY